MKKKILYIDYLSPKGHIGFNRAQIESLKKLDCEIQYMFREGYAKEIGIDNAELLEIPNSYYKSGQFISRVFYGFALNYIRRKTKNSHYDAVIFASFESLSLSLCKIYKGAYLINHNNIRDLDSKIKKLVYKHISHSYTHVVFNTLCQDKLSQNGIEDSLIIPHGFVPLPDYKKSDILSRYSLSENGYIFFPGKGLSAGQITSTIVNDPILLDYCSRKGIRIVTRIGNDNNPNIENITDYLSFDDYYTLLNNCFVSVLCYDNQFKYRVSGILFECMALNIPAVAYHNETIAVYNEYIQSGKLTFCEVTDLCELLDSITKPECNNYYKNLSSIADSSDAWSRSLKIDKIE